MFKDGLLSPFGRPEGRTPLLDRDQNFRRAPERRKLMRQSEVIVLRIEPRRDCLTRLSKYSERLPTHRMSFPCVPHTKGATEVSPRRSLRRGMDFYWLQGGPNTCSASSGKSPRTCPARPRKIFHSPRRANHRYKLAPSHPKKGRLAIVTKRAVGCGGRGSVGAQQVIAGRASRERSTGADERRFSSAFANASAVVHSPAKPLAKTGCGRRSRVVLASVADVKFAEEELAQPGFGNPSIR